MKNLEVAVKFEMIRHVGIIHDNEEAMASARSSAAGEKASCNSSAAASSSAASKPSSPLSAAFAPSQFKSDARVVSAYPEISPSEILFNLMPYSRAHLDPSLSAMDTGATPNSVNMAKGSTKKDSKMKERKKENLSHKK